MIKYVFGELQNDLTHISRVGTVHGAEKSMSVANI